MRLNNNQLTDLAEVGAAIGGLGWYDRAREQITAYASQSPWLSPTVVAAALAIVSPRVSVERSIVLADRLLHDNQDGIMKQRVEAFDNYLLTGEIGGSKVSSFFNAMDPLQAMPVDSVVLDSWMNDVLCSAAYGAVGSLASANVYSRESKRLIGLANRLGINPNELQSCIWVGQREACGVPDPVADIDLSGVLGLEG